MTPTHDETNLWIAFNDLHRSLHHAMETALAAEGLPPLRWYDVLWAVEMSGAAGVRARHLRDWLLFEQSNLSRLLRKLVDQGLIQETTCDQDRRAKTLRITARGAELRLRMWRIYGALIHRHMSQMKARGHSEALLETFAEMLEQNNWAMMQRVDDQH